MGTRPCERMCTHLCVCVGHTAGQKAVGRSVEGAAAPAGEGRRPGGQGPWEPSVGAVPLDELHRDGQGLCLSYRSPLPHCLAVAVPISHGRPFPVHKGDWHLLSRLRVRLSATEPARGGHTLCTDTDPDRREVVRRPRMEGTPGTALSHLTDGHREWAGGGDMLSMGRGTPGHRAGPPPEGTEHGQMDPGELPGAGGPGIRQRRVEAFEPGSATVLWGFKQCFLLFGLSFVTCTVGMTCPLPSFPLLWGL